MSNQSTKIELQLVDLNLFSGSSDKFRSAIGGFWETISSSEGSTIEFESFSRLNPSTGYFDKLAVKDSLEETIDGDSWILNKRLPVRIYGDSEYVKNDQFWKTLFLGGTFGEYTYPALYSEKVFGYHYTNFEMPYPALSASTLPTKILEEVEITFDYNRYLPEYQSYADNVESELLMPNYYLINDLNQYKIYEEDSGSFDPHLLNLVTLENTFDDIDIIFEPNQKEVKADWGARGNWRNAFSTLDIGDYSLLNTSYLTSSLPETSLSASTIDWAKHKLKNILLDNTAMEKLYNTDHIQQYSSYFPYYIKIGFPLDDLSDFATSINNANFSSKFIKNLYLSYAEQIPALIPSASAFALNLNYYSGTLDDISLRTNTGNTYFRTVDYPQFLAYCRHTFSSSAENCLFVGERNIYRDSASRDRIGSYRHINAITSTQVISDAVSYLSNSANFDISALSDVYTNSARSIETLAYRIEKIGGPPTGDERTRDVMQNYWFMNSDVSDFNFYDTQVKYNTEYTYTVYCYKLICGFKYQLSNLLLTRQLGCLVGSDQKNGLEFYDPQDSTEPRQDQLYSQMETRIHTINDLTTLAQFASEYEYLADLYLNYEPSMKIVEIPMFTKTLKVVDNPPNKPMLRPYQVIDNSQTIGFEVKMGTFSDTTYSEGISTVDALAASSYLYAKDLLPTEDVRESTVSGPRYIEIYRVTEKPTQISDFEDALYSTLDLQASEPKNNYTADFFENIVRTNQKYYYLFRVLNEQFVAGHLSDIYEAELVNDGGYLYSVFNVISEAELEEDVYNNPSKTFKKLLQIKPRYDQVELDTDNVDYLDSAGSQIENLIIGTSDDLIWDRTFKFRLTSKKTSKKIDLNITYTLNSE